MEPREICRLFWRRGSPVLHVHQENVPFADMSRLRKLGWYLSTECVSPTESFVKEHRTVTA